MDNTNPLSSANKASILKGNLKALPVRVLTSNLMGSVLYQLTMVRHNVIV